MGTYRFYQDQKSTVWDRNFFSVEAQSYEAAVERVLSIKDKTIQDSEGDGINFIECQTLYETQQQLTPQENGGCPTLEMFDENEIEIGSNAES